ncbi:cytochrome c-type biogenesis protein [Marinomonas epiphytica]
MRLTLFFVITFSLLSQFSWAQQPYSFRSELNEKRYFSLIEELRCPKCQNQNLADSESQIAADLREQVFLLLKEGKTDQEIMDYMVARYGEFVLYRPVYKPGTWLLWYGPFSLLIGGLLVFYCVIRRNRVVQQEESEC